MSSNEVNLRFYREYRSIKHIDDFSLPSFTVLTGKNGSGKSHLLEAISVGAIQTDVSNDPRKEVRLFNWNTIVPIDNDSYSLGDWSANVESIIRKIESIRQNQINHAKSQLEGVGGDPKIIETHSEIKMLLDLQKRGVLTAEESRAASIYESTISQYQNSYNSALNDQKLVPREAFAALWKKNRLAIPLGTKEEIREHLDEYRRGSIELFQQAFARIFVEYMRKWQNNTISKALDRPFLSEDEFVNKNHIPPWDFVNDILEKSRLPFRINQPDPVNIHGAYDPKLIKDDGIEMKFEDLSSGEKVLMSFALCVYNAFGEDTVFPKILLLDEVDAPLHPEMVDIILKVISENLVETAKIKVVLSTHKPTTVALAPEESIYQIFDSSRVEKISREKAVSMLTVGVPTMAFTSDLRRQVFTEGKIDAFAMNSIYQLYKSEITSDQSLVFIPAGRKLDMGDVDGGCGSVFNIVEKLRSNGVSTVYGLVDWDGNNKPKGSVKVLCEGSRHSLENLVLDPIIIISWLIKDHRAIALERGIIESSDGYIDIASWTPERWQLAVDILMDNLQFDASDTVSVPYKNGMSIFVPKLFLTVRGHDLYDRLKVSFGKVMDRYNGDSFLLNICKNILPDVKSFAPKDMYLTVDSLASGMIN